MNVADPNAVDNGSPLEYYTVNGSEYYTMKRKWPTLEGRLSQPLTSRGEALLQMKNNGDILTPLAEKELDKYMKKEMENFEQYVDGLSDERLTALKDRIDMLRDKRDRERMMAKTMTKDQLIRLYEHFGFVIPKGSKFWKVTGPNEQHRGRYVRLAELLRLAFEKEIGYTVGATDEKRIH